MSESNQDLDLKRTFYSDEQMLSNFGDGTENHFWPVARKKFILRQLKNYGQSSDVILEIGCGRGIVVDYLLANGLNCYGVELGNATPIRDQIAERFFMATRAEDLPNDFRLKVKTILLLDVLEHMPNPEDFLASLRKHFPNAISYFVTLPAYQILWSNYDIFYGHHKRYNLTDAFQLLGTLRFKKTQGGYFFHSLYLPLLTLNILKIRRETKVPAPMGSRQSFVHKVLSFFFYFDAILIPKKLPGSSLWVIVQN